MTERDFQLESYCNDLDYQLEHGKVRPEEVDKRMALLQPLESAVAEMSAPPTGPNTAAGRVAQSLWHKNHPEDADLDRLVYFLSDESAIVRLVATEAITGALETPRSKQTLSAKAKRVIRELQSRETSPVVQYGLDRIVGLAEKRRRRPTSSKPLASPYVAGLPVRNNNFFGRNDILDRIKKSLMRMGSKGIVLFGARRTGKTSVLHRVRGGALGRGFFCVYADMQAFAGASIEQFVAGFLRTIDEAVRQELPEVVEGLLSRRDKNLSGLGELREYIQELLARLQPTSLVLLLDEYELLENILSTPDLARQLQNLLETEENLYAIFASARKIETLKQKQLSSLLDTFSYIKLSFLDRDDAIDLIRNPAKPILEFSDEAVEKILILTGGHPFYVQLICQLVFDIVTSEGQSLVTEDHIEKAVSLFLQSPSPHLILTWNGLSFDEQVVGVALANLQKEKRYVSPNEVSSWLTKQGFPMAPRPSENEQSLAAFRDIDWVEKEPQENAYRLAMELVRRWILESRSIRELAEKHLEDILAKVPSFWRQRGTFWTDFLLASFLCILTGVEVEKLSANSVTVWTAVLVGAFIYFVVPIFLRRSTLGMRLWQLGVVRASGRPMDRGLSFVYGLVVLIRAAVLAAVLVEGVFLLWAPSSLPNFVVGVAAGGLQVLDNLMTLFGKRRQGLYEKLVRVILVPAAIARD